MGTKERREREKETLRQEILDAARELFVEEGYENVSMRKIADKIEYSPTTIYLYFKDKAELLHHLTEETFAKLIKSLDTIRRQSKDPVATLKECGRAYINFGLKHPNDYRVTFMITLDLQDTGEYRYEGSMGQKAFGYLREGVAECVRQKKIRVNDIDATSQALWAAMHGLTSLLIAHHDFPWVDKETLIDHLLDTIIKGLKP